MDTPCARPSGDRRAKQHRLYHRGAVGRRTCGGRFHSSTVYPDSCIAVDDDLPRSNWALAVNLSEWICSSMSVSVPADHLEPAEHAVDRPGGRTRRSGHLAEWPGQSGELQ